MSIFQKVIHSVYYINTVNVESRKVCNALTVNSFFVTKKTLFLLQSRTSQSVSFVNKHVSAVSSVSVFAAVLICKCKGSRMYSSVFRYTNTWIGHASRLSAALKWRPLRLGPRMCYCSSQQQPSTCCSQSDSWGPRESNQIEWNCFWICTYSLDIYQKVWFWAVRLDRMIWSLNVIICFGQKDTFFQP